MPVCVVVMDAGKDGSRAFVTGDFTDSGLTDDVSGLSRGQWLSLLQWFQFYDRQYIYVGMMCRISFIYMLGQSSTGHIVILCEYQDASGQWSEAS